MLNVLRESFKRGPYLKWVLIAVGVSLVFYLGNYFIGGTPGADRNSWAVPPGRSWSSGE